MGRRRQREAEERDAALVLLGRNLGRTEERERSLLSILARIARRLFGREVSEVSRAVSERGPDGAVRALGGLAETWAERWRDSFEPAIEEIYDSAPVQTDRGEASISFDLQNPAMEEYFRDYLVRFSTEVTEGTQQRVTDVIREAQKEGLSVPETAKRVEALGDKFSRTRANLVARQELQRSSKGAAYIKAKTSGVVTTKSRLSAKDARVRPEHREIDGETVGIDEEYSNGEQYCGEHDFACRCVDIYGVDTEALGA